MFLKETTRCKDGKEHHYWSLVENRRVDGGRKVVQRHVLYLGEINSSQQEAWRKTIEIFESGSNRARTVALFPEERAPEIDDEKIVRIRLDQLETVPSAPMGRLLAGQCALPEAGVGRLLDCAAAAQPQGHTVGSGAPNLGELSIDRSGQRMAFAPAVVRQERDGRGLLGADYRLAVVADTLYRCLDQIVEHKVALFAHLQQRWKDLFGVQFDVLLYDLTST